MGGGGGAAAVPPPLVRHWCGAMARPLGWCRGQDVGGRGGGGGGVTGVAVRHRAVVAATLPVSPARSAEVYRRRGGGGWCGGSRDGRDGCDGGRCALWRWRWQLCVAVQQPGGGMGESGTGRKVTRVGWARAWPAAACGGLACVSGRGAVWPGEITARRDRNTSRCRCRHGRARGGRAGVGFREGAAAHEGGERTWSPGVHAISGKRETGKRNNRGGVKPNASRVQGGGGSGPSAAAAGCGVARLTRPAAPPPLRPAGAPSGRPPPRRPAGPSSAARPRGGAGRPSSSRRAPASRRRGR